MDVEVCSLGLLAHDTLTSWILGLNFFENYYTIFDQANQKVGLTVSKTATKRVFDYKKKIDF